MAKGGKGVGGYKCPNTPLQVQKTPGGRVGGTNKSVQVQKTPGGRTGGTNPSVEVSPK